MKRNRASFKRIIENFGEKVADAGKEELKRGAEKMVATAKSLCPVKTGKLRDSIHIEESRDGSKLRIVCDAKSDGEYYGKIVEFSPKIAKPFMMPARDAHASETRNAVIDAIRKAAREDFK